MRSGDFTGLAKKYSSGRPGYSTAVLRAISGMLDRGISEASVADIGAGTGIWTRMISELRPRQLFAVEPNDDMRLQGQLDSRGNSTEIIWKRGSGTETGLSSASFDWVTMASSFHWVDFDAGVAEFARILRRGGWFTALWNPRLPELHPLLAEIEKFLVDLKPDLVRKSSGRSGITTDLTSRLEECGYFDKVVYMESKHQIRLSVEQYVDAWRSVNDIQVQLGNDKFSKFIEFVEGQLSGASHIDATYLTRAWSAQILN